MGRSPILILACLCTLVLGAGNTTDGTDAGPVDAQVVFDASAYLSRMGSVDVDTLPTFHGSVLTGSTPNVGDPVQSVPLPPAVFGMATLGAGWLAMRGVRAARRRYRLRR